VRRGSLPTHLGTLDSLEALEKEEKADQMGHQDGRRPQGQGPPTAAPVVLTPAQLAP
jgi:hypothetical protein